MQGEDVRMEREGAVHEELEWWTRGRGNSNLQGGNPRLQVKRQTLACQYLCDR